MRRIAPLTVLLALVLAGSAPTAGLRLVSRRALDARLSELTFRTPALAGPTKVRVLVPRGYATAGHRRYPVLYLLHGAFDGPEGWTVRGDAEAVTAGLPLIVVMPDGGIVGNYADWWNHGAFGLPRWETYHVDELIPWIDAHLRTVPRRAARAIAGLSMGGGGAMKYAARHPDLFVAAASFSGAVDTNSPVVQFATTSSGALDGDHRPGAIYGDRRTQAIRWRNSDPWDLAANLRGLRLWIFTGNGEPTASSPFDGVEAEVHRESVAFADRLRALHIPRSFSDYGPGAHRWSYWNQDLRRTLPGLMRAFAHPPRAPTPFSYRRADPVYRVFGWTVRIDRPALEWSDLHGAGPAGLALSGSGRARVTTARMFAPGARIRVRLASAAGTSVHTVDADAAGRLHLAFSLGPGNPRQEDTAGARTRVFTTRATFTRPAAPRRR